MFIPVSTTQPSQGLTKYVSDAHVSLEAVIGFFQRGNQTDPKDKYIVETAENEYYVSLDTYNLLKSLVLRS